MNRHRQTEIDRNPQRHTETNTDTRTHTHNTETTKTKTNIHTHKRFYKQTLYTKRIRANRCEPVRTGANRCASNTGRARWYNDGSLTSWNGPAKCAGMNGPNPSKSCKKCLEIGDGPRLNHERKDLTINRLFFNSLFLIDVCSVQLILAYARNPPSPPAVSMKNNRNLSELKSLSCYVLLE